MVRWSRRDKTRGISITLPHSTLVSIDEFMKLNPEFESRSELIDIAVKQYIKASSKTSKEAV